MECNDDDDDENDLNACDTNQMYVLQMKTASRHCKINESVEWVEMVCAPP